MNVVGKAIYIVGRSVELLFLLPAAVCSRRVFDWAWRLYYRQRLDKSVFNLCVQWLLYVGANTGLSYTKINVVIFCVVWPMVTIISMALNVVLILKLARG